MNLEKIIVHHRSPHHASNSGYARLIDFISDAKLVTGNSNFPYRFAKFISQNTNQLAGNYDSLSVLKEIELFKCLSNNKQQLVHYLNAERDIRYIVNYKKFFKNTIFCGTFHKPPSILKEQIVNTKYLKKLDGAIAVGENQVEFLKDWLGIKNVQYIPHGVDTNFFKPAIKKPKEQRILFVGQHLRDFEVFNNSIKVLFKKFPKLKVDVVIHQSYIKFVETHSSINIHSGISDIQLRNLYQNAILLFLPLKDVTACNSILEAMACGLPIVTTNVGGNTSYLKDSENILLPKSDSDAYVDVISNLLNNENRLYSIGQSSLLLANNYDWQLISNQVVTFYENITA